MEVRELRIGNWITDLFDINNVKEIQVDLDLFQSINNFHKSNHPYPIRPIPLTEEWLLKFGFKECLNTFELSLEKDSDLGYVKIGCLFKKTTVTLEIAGNRMPIYDLKYVHQLQNLYFALTGKELS